MSKPEEQDSKIFFDFMGFGEKPAEAIELKFKDAKDLNSSLKSLTAVNFDRIKISSVLTREDFKEILRFVKSEKKLKNLDFSDLKIGDLGALYIFNELCGEDSPSDFSNLMELSFKNWDMGDFGLERLGYFVKKCHSLKKLDLSGNNRPDDFRYILKATVKTKLEILDLENTNFSKKGSAKLLFTDLAPKMHYLKYLNLDKNPIFSNGIAYCGEFLKKNPCLEILGLSGCCVTYKSPGCREGKGFLKFSNALAKNKNLKTLRLGSNEIEGEFFDAIYIILKRSFVIDLDLSNNSISAEGFKSIWVILKNIPDFKSLNIINNPIESQIIKDSIKEGSILKGRGFKMVFSSDQEMSPTSTLREIPIVKKEEGNEDYIPTVKIEEGDYIPIDPIGSESSLLSQ